MQGKIQGLFKNTVIYGMGNFVSRGITFLLLPLLTNSMSPAEYGKLSIIQTFIGLAEVFFAVGMRQSILRYSAKDKFTREEAFSGGVFWIIMASVVGSAVLMVFRPFFEGVSGLHSSIIYRYMIFILILDALSIPPYAVLQMAGRPLYYALLKVANVSVYFGGCFYLVFLKGQADVDAVLTANIAASAVLILLCLPVFLKHARFKLPWGLLKPMLRFGAPYIPNVVFVVTMDLINRVFIGRMLGLEAAGYFTAAIKLALIMYLVVYAFQTAWQPFFLSHLNDPHGGRLFARVFTYYLLATCAVFLFIGVFYREIASLHFRGFMLIGSEYHSGLNIIPIVLLAYAFCGMYSNFIVGIYAREKSYIIPLITFVGAAVNVAANFLLIPVLKLTGAALATLLSYIVITVILYPVSQRLYAVHYEWKRIIRIAACTAGVFACAALFQGLAARIAAVAAFLPLLVLTGSFEREEIEKLKLIILRKNKE